MQNTDRADLRAEVSGIGGYLQQSLRAGCEEQVVELAWVLEGQHIEFMGYREDHMKVVGGEKFSLARGEPLLACFCTLQTRGGCGRSYKRWPDDRTENRYPDGRQEPPCGSSEWPEKL